MPEIDSDNVYYIVIKAREFEVDKGATGDSTYDEMKNFNNCPN